MSHEKKILCRGRTTQGTQPFCLDLRHVYRHETESVKTLPTLFGCLMVSISVSACKGADITQPSGTATNASGSVKNNPEPICKDGGATTPGCVWVGQKWIQRCGGDPSQPNAWIQAYPSATDMTQVVWDSPIPQDYVIVGHRQIDAYPKLQWKCNAKLIMLIPQNEKEYWDEWDNDTNRPPQGWKYDGKRRRLPVDSFCEWGDNALFYQRHLIRLK